MKNATNNPVIASFPSMDHPAVPDGLKVTCLKGPDTLDSCDQCPVVAWNEYIYWAYSFHDNRDALAIVAYTEDGTLVKRWDMKGARYVYKITSDENKKTITFWGQSDQKIVMSWDDLFLLEPPVIGNVPAKVHPSVPSGLKVDCIGPGDFKSGEFCPVMEWNDLTYWAYSYLDNRDAITIVAYNPEGKIIKQWEKTGARYIYKMTSDVAAETVTFWGQADAKIVMGWKELLCSA